MAPDCKQSWSGRLITPSKPWAPTPGLSRIYVLIDDSDNDSENDNVPCGVCQKMSPPSLKKPTSLPVFGYC